MNSLNAITFLLLVVVALYAVFGGADFGGGVWDLLATGPRRNEQRDAITHAIGPVWEANHVWLIFANVILFTCFPIAFAAVFTGLYWPLSFALVGIVLRGAAFVFRNYANDMPVVERGYTVVFGIASLIAPFFFGDAAGALATGRYAWSEPFALSTGLFAVVVCAQLAAVFILSEIPPGALRDDFRRRAVRATMAVWVAGIIPVACAAVTEPHLFTMLRGAAASPAVLLAVIAGLAVIACVVMQRDGIARVAAGVEAVAILAGWFGAQAPEIIPGQLTFVNAATSRVTLDAFLIAAGTGAIFLVPSLIVLFRMFKMERRT